MNFQEEQINPDPEGWVLDILSDPDVKVVIVEDTESVPDGSDGGRRKEDGDGLFGLRKTETENLLDTSFDGNADRYIIIRNKSR